MHFFAEKISLSKQKVENGKYCFNTIQQVRHKILAKKLTANNVILVATTFESLQNMYTLEPPFTYLEDKLLCVDGS